MKARTKNTSTNAPAQDSFLDVVANMVGILIILVMVMGMRAGEAPLEAARDVPPPDDQQLRAILKEESSLRSSILEKAAETKRLAAEAAQHKRGRDTLAVVKAGIERKIVQADGELDEKSRAELQLRRKLAAARDQFDSLRQRKHQIESQPVETIVLANYPTPISRTVHGDELHFQVRDNRIAYVPLQELVDRLKREIPRVRNAMRHNHEYTDTLGPIDGFRMRYTFRRRDLSPEMAVETGRYGSVFRLELAEFLPVRSLLGEPIDMAVREGSELRDRLRRHPPGRTTVTLWVYPDSFEQFRMLRELLHKAGFSVAARPLPEGVAISGSPLGTKSAAE